MRAVLRHIVSKFHRPSSYNLKDVEHYVDEQTSRQTDRQAGRKRILRAVKKAEQWRAEREGGGGTRRRKRRCSTCQASVGKIKRYK